jgi:hypothetical protein
VGGGGRGRGGGGGARAGPPYRTLGSTAAPTSTQPHALQPTAEAARIALGGRARRAHQTAATATAGVYCTECEAEGFRRIAPFQDRPDVMARSPTPLSPANRPGGRTAAAPVPPATRPHRHHPTSSHRGPQTSQRCGAGCVRGRIDAARSGGGGVGSYTRVRIEADRAACPVLLSNGNLIAKARPAPFAPT